MSGSRHHVIPQFLLRGFSSHMVGDASYAWVYRKGRRPFNTNVINIAVEGHFYTHDGNSDVDDDITASEGEFGNIVDALRHTNSVKGFSNLTLARLFSHLEVRTRHLRLNFENIGNTFLTHILQFISDDAAFSAYILRRFEREPEMIFEPLVQEIRSRGIPTHQAGQLIEILRPQLSTLLPAMLPSLMSKFSNAVQYVAAKQPEMLKTAARSGQLRALRNDIAPEIKTARYSQLTFSILRAEMESLPLGDSAVLAQIDAPRKYTTFVGADDYLVGIYLPLSPTSVLCGHPPEHTPSLCELPLAIARCSVEYLVGHKRSPQLEQYQPKIGELADIIDDQTMEELLLEVFNERAD